MSTKFFLILILIAVPTLLLFSLYMFSGSLMSPADTFTNLPTPPSNQNDPDTQIDTKIDQATDIAIETSDGVLRIRDPRQLTTASSLGASQYSVTDIDTYSTAAFSVVFNETNNSFAVALLEEPLARSREEAERYLTRELGINRDELCLLETYVGVTYQVNQSYAGKNLGFSSCSGGVVLE